MSKTAEIFKKYRLQSGNSQNIMACKLNYNNGQYISNFERGKCVFPYGAIHEAIKIFTNDPFERFTITNEFERAIAEDEVTRFRNAKT